MELNEPMNNHEHASVSLKVILLIFCLVLIGALSYFVYISNSTADTTDNTAPSVKSKTTETANTDSDATTADETANWSQYSNSALAFSVKYPGDWKIDSKTLDAYTSAKAAFNGGATFRLYKGSEEQMTEKIEFYLNSAEATTLEKQLSYVADYTETSKKTLESGTWSFGVGKNYGNETNVSVQAHSLFAKEYPGLTNKYVYVQINGYYFTGTESSKFDEAQAALVEKIASTARITK